MAFAIDDVDLARDRDLVVRAQSGDDEAFGALYERYFRRLVRFAAKRVGNLADAEEIAQEAFARAYRGLPTFAGERRFYPWLTVITARLCIDSLRRSGRVQVTDLVVETEWEDTGFERLERDGDVALVTKALSRITPRHREVLELRERDGWSYQRIADHYQVSLGTVEALLWRARKALRREYEGLGALISSIPLIRRLSAWRALHPNSTAAVAAVGTLAAVGVAAGFGVGSGPSNPPRPATPTQMVYVAAHRDVASAPASVAAQAPAPTSAALATRPASGQSTAPPAPLASRPAPITFMNHTQASQAVSHQQVQVSAGPVGVGVSPDVVGPLTSSLVGGLTPGGQAK